MDSTILLEEVNKYLTLKEILYKKTQLVDAHYKKLDSYWKVEDRKDYNRSDNWFKINLKKRIDPITNKEIKPYIKITFSRQAILMRLKDLTLPKSELDNTHCTETVKTAEYLLTNCVDEFMLKLQDRISKEKTRSNNRLAKGLQSDNSEFIYNIESFYNLFVSLRSCILDNPNKITFGKLTIK